MGLSEAGEQPRAAKEDKRRNGMRRRKERRRRHSSVYGQGERGASGRKKVRKMP